MIDEKLDKYILTNKSTKTEINKEQLDRQIN